MMTGKDAFVVKRLRDAGRGDDREVEHGGVRVQPGRNGQLDPARLYAQPVTTRAASRPVRAADRRPAPRGQLRGDRRSPATPAIRSADRPRTRRSSACARRWDW